MDRGIITISETGVVIMPTAPIWMTQFEIADLFGMFSCDVRKAIHTIYKNKELNKVISTVIDMAEANGDSIINNFGIILDQNDNYMYIAESNTQRLRFIADVYGQATIDKLTEEQKSQTAQEIIDVAPGLDELT